MQSLEYHKTAIAVGVAVACGLLAFAWPFDSRVFVLFVAGGLVAAMAVTQNHWIAKLLFLALPFLLANLVFGAWRIDRWIDIWTERFANHRTYVECQDDRSQPGCADFLAELEMQKRRERRALVELWRPSGNITNINQCPPDQRHDFYAGEEMSVHVNTLLTLDVFIEGDGTLNALNSGTSRHAVWVKSDNGKREDLITDGARRGRYVVWSDKEMSVCFFGRR